MPALAGAGCHLSCCCRARRPSPTPALGCPPSRTHWRPHYRQQPLQPRSLGAACDLLIPLFLAERLSRDDRVAMIAAPATKQGGGMVATSVTTTAQRPAL